MKNILVLLIAVFASLSLYAQNKGLDPSFGDGGIVFQNGDQPSYFIGIGSIGFHSDERILTWGGAGLKRYDENGSIDNSFLVLQLLPGKFIKVQPDGKILIVANLWWQTNQYSVLTRLNADGTIDSAFGNNGNGMDTFFKSNLDISTAALLLQPDNKIILVARTTSNMIYLTRLLPDGLIDSSFGNNGVVMDYSSAPRFEAKGAVLQADGKIIVGVDDFNYTAVRYFPSGDRDTAYGNAGIASYPGLSFVNAVSLQADGKLLLAGTDFGVPQSDTVGVPFQLVRFDTTGNIDTSFNHTGLGLYTWGGGTANKCRAMVVQPDGKILLGGRVWNEVKQDYDFGVLRVLPDGKLDNSFGEFGKLRTRIGNNLDDQFALALQTDGKIIAGGYSECDDEDLCIKGVLLRYLPDGETSITEPLLNASFIVYPNPVNDKVYLLSKGSLTVVSIILTDMVGRIILTRTCTSGAQEIGLSNLKAGIYIFIITDSNNKTERFKIVKQ